VRQALATVEAVNDALWIVDCAGAAIASHVAFTWTSTVFGALQPKAFVMADKR
jgi:ribosome biogenesis protein Tsr3